MNHALLFLFTLTFFGGARLWAEDEMPEHVVPVLQNWLHYNTDVVEFCVFREKWTAPTEKVPKGHLIRYGTVTRVYKGKLSVGDKILVSSLVEYAPEKRAREAKLRPDRISLVDGELSVVIFTASDAVDSDGYWDGGDDISRFSFDSYFYRALLSELNRDTSLKGRSN